MRKEGTSAVILVGQMCAGKTTAADCLKSFGFHHISCGQIVAEMARGKGLAGDRDTLQRFASHLLDTGSMDLFSRRLLGDVRKHRLVTIDGLRSVDTLRMLKSELAHVLVLYVRSLFRSRLQRAWDLYGVNRAGYVRLARNPIELQIAKSRRLVDVEINNSGEVDDFRSRLGHLFAGPTGWG